MRTPSHGMKRLIKEIGQDGKLVRRAVENYGVEVTNESRYSYDEMKTLLEDAIRQGTTYHNFLRTYFGKDEARYQLYRVMSDTGMRLDGWSPKALEVPYRTIRKLYVDECLPISKIKNDYGIDRPYFYIYTYGLPKPSQRNESYRERTVENMTDLQRQTFKEHYGVTNPNKSDEIKRKISETNERRYGVSPAIPIGKCKIQGNEDIRSEVRS